MSSFFERRNIPPVYEIFLKCRPLLLLYHPLQLASEEFDDKKGTDIDNELSEIVKGAFRQNSQ